MRSKRSYPDYIERKEREHGEKWDTSDLDPRFVSFFETGERIKVRTLGEEMTGTIGVTSEDWSSRLYRGAR